MKSLTEKLIDVGSLTYGPNTKVEVFYVIEMFPGDQPSIQDIEGEVHRIGKRADFGDLMGRQLTLILRDGGKLGLSLDNANGHFRTNGSIEQG
jgi:hypothetical protein